jgi:hypothetical protein
MRGDPMHCASSLAAVDDEGGVLLQSLQATLLLDPAPPNPSRHDIFISVLLTETRHFKDWGFSWYIFMRGFVVWKIWYKNNIGFMLMFPSSCARQLIVPNAAVALAGMTVPTVVFCDMSRMMSVVGPAVAAKAFMVMVSLQFANIQSGEIPTLELNCILRWPKRLPVRPLAFPALWRVRQVAS